MTAAAAYHCRLWCIFICIFEKQQWPLPCCRAAQESTEGTSDTPKQEEISLEDSSSSSDPREPEAAATDTSASPALYTLASPNQEAAEAGQEAGQEAGVALPQQHVRRPARISVGFSQAGAEEAGPEAGQEAEAESTSRGPPRLDDLHRQLTQLMSQNTELMSQLEDANSSLASSQELCTDLEVSVLFIILILQDQHDHTVASPRLQPQQS